MFYLVITIIKLLVVILKYKNNHFFWPNCADLQTGTANLVFFIISDKEKVYLKTFLVTVQILCADCGIEMKE